jgi:predicted methyltransferase
MPGTRRVVLAALVAAVAAVAPVGSQGEAADPSRLIDALQLRPGSVIAEIGAGDGKLTLALAAHVGEGGRVFTTELGAERLERLREAVATSGLSQVEVLEAHERRTNLTDACCDAVLMRDVYHHFDDPAAMNASVFAALKPGGRVAVIDFGPSGQEADDASGRDRSGHHGVGRQTVSRELDTAGFTAVSGSTIGGRRFMVVAQKPASGS